MDAATYPPTHYQEKVLTARARSDLERARRVAGIFATLSIILAIVACIASVLAYQMTMRYANNVRVAWVKLSPSSTHEVEYLDDGADRERYDKRVLEASFINYATSRFRENRHTVTADYGLAYTFLGPEERQKFVGEFDAHRKSQEIAACGNCGSIDVTVRAVTTDKLVDATADTTPVYKTTIYFDQTKRDATGIATETKSQIAFLNWKLVKPGEIPDDRTFLVGNPLGIQIIQQEVRDDIQSATGTAQ
jgi:hypothetical protein